MRGVGQAAGGRGGSASCHAVPERTSTSTLPRGRQQQWCGWCTWCGTPCTLPGGWAMCGVWGGLSPILAEQMAPERDVN